PPPLGGYGFRDLVVPFLLCVLPMGLIMRQHDLGTALSVGAVGFGMILFMGIRLKALVIMAVFVVVTALPIWGVLKPYQQRRVLALFNPEADPLGSGYHIIQSKIAVGSGGLFGKGYLAGTQSQLEFLPEHTTDFVFSVLAEEWGFVGAMVLLLVYFCFLYRMLRSVEKSKDLFSGLVVFGVALLLFFHMVVNIGMVIGILPVVGIPLLLVSYGGSSVVTTMFMVGLVLGLNMRRLSFGSKT
ncbi:MAG: rod shape-determining protein RodA, partial [Deltaproteobacteria bacterium]|nr:rod shape-determining protein RodA [Deltaproteobacteria bacterium]